MTLCNGLGKVMYYIEYESGYRMVFFTFSLFLNALNKIVTIDAEGGNLFDAQFKCYGRKVI